MASGVHIPFEDLSAENRALLERTNQSEGGVIFIDGHVAYRISRLPGRTAAESLALIGKAPDANVQVGDEWSDDMQHILNRRHSEPRRNPWE